MEEPNTAKEQPSSEASPEEQLSENFISVYANNSRYELSVWDLKIFFGQLSHFPEKQAYIDWHTAVTLPWFQAKILSYFLQVNIASYESQNGRLAIPPNIVPPPPVVPSGELENNPAAKELYENMVKLYRELTGGN